MSLFSSTESTTAFMKAGLMGLAGSGKTYTATKIAIGLQEYIGSKKPILFLDTETGSDWVRPVVQDAGHELNVFKTGAFKDLVPAVQEAESSGCILLVDSITHFWDDLKETYRLYLCQKYRNSNVRLEFHHWAHLKAEWKKFSTLFVNSQCHIIMAGRAGYEYEMQETEERGAGGKPKKELIKTDIKMKAEGEMGYEPSILIHMERHRDMDTGKNTRTGTILKDRSDKIDGKVFTNPKFENILPHVEHINIGGKHMGKGDQTSEGLFADDGTSQWKQDQRRKIALEEVQQELVSRYPGQSAAEKKSKTDIIEQVFGTRSWTAIESMKAGDLEIGLSSLKKRFEGEDDG